jgi:hypothetical protein
MNYILNDLLVRNHSLPPLEPGHPVEKSFRATQFSGTTSQILVVSYAPPGCVRILDPVYDADLYNLPERLIASLKFSRPKELIQDHNPPASPPVDIFGSEPKHRWCYYFEKADLARQNGDWKSIIELSKQSIRKGYRPDDPSEYLPFIEGYIQSSRWADGYELTVSAYQGSLALRPALCSVWRRSASKAADNDSDLTGGYFGKAYELLKCPTP